MQAKRPKNLKTRQNWSLRKLSKYPNLFLFPSIELGNTQNEAPNNRIALGSPRALQSCEKRVTFAGTSK